ncbi:MAG: hypothetical protein Cons2KO_26850 [Congregibacter sp.]
MVLLVASIVVVRMLVGMAVHTVVMFVLVGMSVVTVVMFVVVRVTIFAVVMGVLIAVTVHAVMMLMLVRVLVSGLYGYAGTHQCECQRSGRRQCLRCLGLCRLCFHARASLYNS